MRYGKLIFMLAAATLILGQPASATDAPAYKGLYLSTPFPAVSLPPDEPARLNVTVKNAGLPPERADLKINELPKGWTASFVGQGKPVEAVFVAPNDSVNVQLRVNPPKGEPAGTYHMVISAKGEDGGFTLPLDLTLGDTQPPKLDATADFPDLKGTPSSSYEYKLTINNESDRDALVGLSSNAPAGFEVSFTERYGTQELTSVPIKAGEKKDLKAKVKLPEGIAAGKYKLMIIAKGDGATADLPLGLEVTGQPKLSLSTPDDRLSTQAYAGQDSPLNLVLQNTGSAEARNIKLASSEPNGWTVKFSPEKIDDIPPGGTQSVKATLMPPSKAIAGDYMVTMRANGDGASDSSQFRVTVRTSTLWGIVGVGVIAAALLVLVGAVMKFGRR